MATGILCVVVSAYNSTIEKRHTQVRDWFYQLRRQGEANGRNVRDADKSVVDGLLASSQSCVHCDCGAPSTIIMAALSFGGACTYFRSRLRNSLSFDESS